MLYIHELVTLECQNEHDLEHNLEHKPKFTEPKIFDAKGDLNKRWYVYFSYRNPKTGKLKRMKNIYGKTNRFKTKEERYTILNLYKKRLLKFLKEGYSPFEDNTELYQTQVRKNNNIHSVSEESQTVVVKKKQDENYNEGFISIQNAFDKAILLKTNVVSTTTLTDYQSRINKFLEWLNEYHPMIIDINKVDRKMMVEFLNSVQLKTSARNRNNYRTVLSSIFQILEDNELIVKNFVKSIKPIKSQPKRHKTYSSNEQQAIFEYLDKNDNLLLLFIKFISYNFLRPIEVCRLRVKDIDISQKTLQFQAKNKVLKTKIIPDILLNELPDLKALNGDHFLFTPHGIGKDWEAKLTNRRDHFSKRFKTVIKDHFNLNENYGLYSFRHTFITKIYRAMVKQSSPFEAKSKLMQITGHTTMGALEKYLRDIDAELPEDYSDLLKVKKL